LNSLNFVLNTLSGAFSPKTATVLPYIASSSKNWHSVRILTSIFPAAKKRSNTSDSFNG